ncbi:hypothetical protein HKX48_001293 [Thoreauomyces humboldtii]|nr:hypothetical protein HKX48_001293 [Thoreauomyces humboldtii]
MKLSWSLGSPLLVLLALAPSVLSKTYFKETFSNESWKTRWIQSKASTNYGSFAVTPGAFHADSVSSRALQTQNDARSYALSAAFSEPFDTANSTFILQYSVKFEKGATNCAGGYVKVFPKSIEPTKMDGSTPYDFMFGPDICGPNKKVHFIVSYKGKNVEMGPLLLPKLDRLSHLYTLVVKPDATFEILIDNELEAQGSLFEVFEFFPPKRILDPSVKKPEAWDERETVPDETDEQPWDWDDEPEMIPDPEDPPPSYWDEEVDGEWFCGKVPNPAWKGDWEPRQIPNPNYAGPWIHPEIDNPAYQFDPAVHAHTPAFVGFDLWQVTSGSLFDDIIVTDSVDEAQELAKEFLARRVPEWNALVAFDEEEGRRIAKEKNEGNKKKGHSEL